MTATWWIGWMVAMLRVGPGNGESNEVAARPVDGIRDNSFLIEEAYNQEAGVVQHIFTARFGIDERGTERIRSWDLSFTQEWPVFSQRHQFSFTIPYAFVDPQAEHDSDLGDVLLNYRYQLSSDEGPWPAAAPRVSLILPCGAEDRGFGTGVVGYQVNLPFSKTLSDRLYVNLNAGFTHWPDVSLWLSNGRRRGDYDLLSFNLGGSVIYAVSDRFNILVEANWSSDQGLQERPSAGGRRVLADRLRTDAVVISPGVRWAYNLPGDVQVVPGVALPIGLSRDAIDYGVFLYFSVEHPFIGNVE